MQLPREHLRKFLVRRRGTSRPIRISLPAGANRMQKLQPLIRRLVLLFDREGFSSEFHVTDEYYGANQQVNGKIHGG